MPLTKQQKIEKEKLCECFHYTNIQPLWIIDNLRKGSRYE